MKPNKSEPKQLETHFLAITSDDFNSRLKQPLWSLGDGLLYLSGFKFNFDSITRTTVGRMDFVRKFLGTTTFGNAALNCAYNDYKNKKLELIDVQYFILPEILEKQVASKNLLSWAKNLPFDVPMLMDAKLDITQKYMTPDMELMFDAVTKFWSEYDLDSPNPNIAPFKKDVVSWLLEQAKKRNIQDFSKSKAQMIDTIIRCPISRGGGNTR